MMSDPKRYDQSCGCGLDETEEGDWVKYEDYINKVNELEALHELELREVRNASHEYDD
jgi:hypothetical protein